MSKEVAIPPLPESTGQSTLRDRVVASLARSVASSVDMLEIGQHAGLYGSPKRALLGVMVLALDISPSEVSDAVHAQCAEQGKAVQVFRPSQIHFGENSTRNLLPWVSLGTSFQQGDRVPGFDLFVSSLFAPPQQNGVQGDTLEAIPKGQE